MGQFLATGLVTEVYVSKKEMKQMETSADKLIHEMKSCLHFRSELYYQREDEEYFVFNLKDKIFHEELIPFLGKLYPLIYHQKERTDFDFALAALKSNAPDNWLKLAENKKYEAFQLDSYGMPTYLYRPFGRKIRIYYNSIILSMEGKIVMETYGRQFSFYQYCIAQTFAEFALAGAIRVYITG